MTEGKQQSVAVYTDRFRSICREAGLRLNDVLTKDFYVTGLRTELQPFVRAVEQRMTLMELAYFAGEIEHTQQPRRNHQQPQQLHHRQSPHQQQQQPEASAEPVVVAAKYQRTEDGRPICRKCNKAGHIARHCKSGATTQYAEHPN